MPLTAMTKSGERVLATALTDRNQEFFCRFCKGRMSFVDATLKIKHFRHLVKSSCEYENESAEHILAKDLIFNALLSYGQGKAFVEEKVGRLIADVFWTREWKSNVVFEVQAANYDLSIFEEKIRYYAYRNNLVVYVFIGENFLNEVKPNIYTLKEIEKRIFNDKSYLDSVLGCYLEGNRITVPSFTEKFAKGTPGTCSHRFIIERRWSKSYTIDDYISVIDNHAINQKYSPPCLHKETVLERSSGKIDRYKVVCSECGKFLKWLPNKEALEMGLDFNEVESGK